MRNTRTEGLCGDAFSGHGGDGSGDCNACRQGQTEGRVIKLKLIKRSMYERGRFDLSRQRVMYASAD